MNFAIAVALSSGALDLTHFRKELVRDEALRSLMSKCETFIDEDLDHARASRAPAAQIRVELLDGQVLETVVGSARGNPENPLSHEEIAGKFRQCAGRSIGADQVEELKTAVFDLEHIDDVTQVVALATRRGD